MASFSTPHFFRPGMQWQMVQMGVVVGIVPGDDSFETEVWWAPASTVTPTLPSSSMAAQKARLQPGSRNFVHLVPGTTGLQFYQARHVRSDYADGAFTDWLGASPVPLFSEDLQMQAAPPVTEIKGKQVFGDSQISRSGNSLPSSRILAVEVNAQSEVTTANYAAMNVWLGQNVATTGTMQAIRGHAASNNAAGTIANIEAVAGYGEHAGAGTVSSVRGIVGACFSSGAGTITEGYGGIFGVVKTGAGVITTGYGVYVLTMTASVTNYAFYSNAGTNSFGDHTHIRAGKNLLVGAEPTGFATYVAGGGEYLANANDNPKLVLWDTGGATDSKAWEWNAVAAQLLWRTRNDANSNGENIAIVNRSTGINKYELVSLQLLSDGGYVTIGNPAVPNTADGSCNAQAFYDDGAGPLTDYVFELAYLGSTDLKMPRGYRYRSLAERRAYTREFYHLPGGRHRDGPMLPLGQTVSWLTEKAEEHFLDICYLDDRVDEVEARVDVLERENAALKQQIIILQSRN